MEIERDLERYQWFVDLSEESRERVVRLMAESPSGLHEFERIEIRITPYGGPEVGPRGPALAFTQLLPTAGGNAGPRAELEPFGPTFLRELDDRQLVTLKHALKKYPEDDAHRRQVLTELGRRAKAKTK